MALVALQALDERVGEGPDVPGGDPRLAREDDRGVDADDVVAAGSADAARATLIARTVAALYDRGADTALAELTDVSGTTHALHLADLVSGAVVADVVDRAKRHAVRDYLAAGQAPAALGVREGLPGEGSYLR